MKSVAKWAAIGLFKFQYDNTLSLATELSFNLQFIFKFQYDNTLSTIFP